MYDEKKDDGGWATAGGSSAAAATKRKISKQKKAGKNVKVTGDTLRVCDAANTTPLLSIRSMDLLTTMRSASYRTGSSRPWVC